MDWLPDNRRKITSAVVLFICAMMQVSSAQLQQQQQQQPGLNSNVANYGGNNNLNPLNALGLGSGLGLDALGLSLPNLGLAQNTGQGVTPALVSGNTLLLSATPHANTDMMSQEVPVCTTIKMQTTSIIIRT